jgi:hypothetical protein
MARTQDFNYSDQTKDLSDESSGKAFGQVVRDYKPNASVKWRFGKPNYSVVNKLYFENRTKKHADGTLESVVQKLVKNWEVESHHIADIKDWQTMDVSKFSASVNGGGPASAQLMADIGPYNLLLGDCEGYAGSANTFESANAIFSNAFTKGFAFEVLEVLSPPPVVAFRYRHFGPFSGKYVDATGDTHPGDDKIVDIGGLVVATVSATLQIEKLDIYYDPNAQIKPLLTPTGGERAKKCVFC